MPIDRYDFSGNRLILIAVLWLPLLLALHLCIYDYFSKTRSSGLRPCAQNHYNGSRYTEGKINWILEQTFRLRGMFNYRLERSISTTGAYRLGYAHEILRRRAMNYVNEMNHALSGLFDVIHRLQERIPKNVHNERLSLVKFQQQMNELLSHLQVNLNEMGQVDGFLGSRITGLSELSEWIQKKIRQFQNPVDCRIAKYVTFDFTNLCGFGCSVHQLTFCLQMAFKNGRVLVMKKHPLGDIFREWLQQNVLPLSDKCSHQDSDNRKDNIACPMRGYGAEQHKWIPEPLPNDIAKKLMLYHEAPYAWFAGQLASYILRPKANLSKMINQTLNTFKKKHHPVVGVHVRRTDKLIWEAKFHELTEYMEHVENYYHSVYNSLLLQHNRVNNSNRYADQHITAATESGYNEKIIRSVYLSTDDPILFEQLAKNYSNYNVYGSRHRSQTAITQSRGSLDSLKEVFIDVIALSQTDFLVCTFSSNLCRLGYELMQTRHEDLGDATQLVRSLDYMHQMEDYSGIKFDVLIPDIETKLNYGDLVSLGRSHWPGHAAIHLLIRNGVRDKKIEKGVPTAKKTQSQILPTYKFRPQMTMSNFSWT
ncbi:unnamed protein product [Heterobilharzia americana]|nr:unnamed protein product [Heterobilharzia americana]